MKAIDLIIAQQMDNRRNQLIYPNGPLAAPAPLQPLSINTFDNAGTIGNKDKPTDGLTNTSMDTLIKDVTGNATLGDVIYDLGSVKTVEVGGQVGLWVSTGTGTIYVYIDSSETSPSSGFINPTRDAANVGATSETKRRLDPQILTGRYIKLRATYSGSTACRCNVNLYELFADLKPIK